MSKTTKAKAISIGCTTAAVAALVLLPQGTAAVAKSGTSQLISSELRLPIAVQGQSLVECDLFDPNQCKSTPLTPGVSVDSIGVAFEYTYRAGTVDRLPDVLSQAGKLRMPQELAGHRCSDKHGVLAIVSGAAITPGAYETKINGQKHGDAQEQKQQQSAVDQPAYLIRCLEQTPPAPLTVP